MELAQQSGLTFTHTNLIQGHVYKYRVKASNFLGYGAYSSEFSFTPATLPASPSSALVLNTASSSKTVVHLTLGEVEDNGGAEITQYNVYADDGNYGSIYTNGPYTVATSALIFDTTTAGLALTVG